MTSGSSPQAFEQLLGADRVDATDADELDAVPIAFSVRPADPEQVAATLALARERKVAVVPRGGATKLHFGNVCSAEFVVALDTTALQGVCEIEPEEGVAVVSAGVPVSAFAARCQGVGKRTLLPLCFDQATVGGSVAVDPIQPCQSIGTRLRNDLLGLEVARSDGALARCGGRVVKNVTGFDLVRLHCGAMGTLGVVTEVAVRLRPIPECVRVSSRETADPTRALEIATALLYQGVDPAGIAWLPRAGAGRAGAGEGDGRLLWRIEGGESDVAERAARVAGDPLETSVWATVGARLAESRSEEDHARVRVSGRGSDVPRILAAIAAVAGELAVLEVVLPLVGSVWTRLPLERVGALSELCAAGGWVLFVENAPRAVKERIDVFGAAVPAAKLQRAVKERFDPGAILSPGRFAGRI